MATKTGTDGLVSIGGNTVAELVSFSYDQTGATIPNNTLATQAEVHRPGRTGWTGSIECHWEKTDTTGQGAMAVSSVVDIVFMLEGDTSGYYKESGTAIITGVSTPIADESMITRSYSLIGTGPLVEGTIS